MATALGREGGDFGEIPLISARFRLFEYGYERVMVV